MSEAPRATGPAPVVWDGPIRLVHWSLVGLIGIAWYTAKVDMMDWHKRAGYAILALLLFRLIWGVVGTRTARFSTFVRGPGAILRYFAGFRERAPGGEIGHNPAGALSVIAMLVVLLLQVASGLFAVDVDGIESGPLSDRVSFDQGRWLASLHHISFSALEILVCLHVAAIVFYLVYKRDNLVQPMVTGRRRGARAGTTPTSLPRLVGAMALAIAVCWFISTGLRG